MKGIPVCANNGTGPLQRGNCHKNVKIGWARSFENHSQEPHSQKIQIYLEPPDIMQYQVL
jgi:hypothetical protein